MWLDAIALGVLGLFAGLGMARGGLATGLSLIALVGGYAAAVLLGPAFAPQAAALTGSPPWLGVAAAGTAAFLSVFLLLSLVGSLVRRAEHRVEGERRSPRDRFLGAVFGLARGGLVVLLLSYLALWVDALRTTGTVENLPEIEGSTAAALTEDVVEAGVEAAVGDAAAGRVMARVAARPGRALADLQEVVEHPGFAALREDPLFWGYVEHGSLDAAMNRGGFVTLARDAELRRRLGELGLIEPEAAESVSAFRDAAREVLGEVGPRLRALREDPAVHALLEDPEVVAAVQSGDHFALVQHPGFRAVVARVLESDPGR